ncbi:hypothetical protein [Arsenicicoccus piscis]|uniref:DUF4162 domain-containing protein n=1 Tax=Arsenicicoccus piscis TaxID=673954 RepID=A0ABQ6HUU0_9MICO|nr:hypothetical protein GCM10025862_34790 [Arsenicicoccus piscis]
MLLSSHLLHEVQLIADDIVMIGRGRILAQGRLDELVAQGGITVRSLDDAALTDALRRDGLVVTSTNDALVVDGTPEQVGRAALAAGVVLLELRQQERDLERMFLDLTSSTDRGHQASDTQAIDTHATDTQESAA